MRGLARLDDRQAVGGNPLRCREVAHDDGAPRDYRVRVEPLEKREPRAHRDALHPEGDRLPPIGAFLGNRTQGVQRCALEIRIIELARQSKTLLR